MAKNKVVSMKDLEREFLYNGVKYQLMKRTKYNTLVCDDAIDSRKLEHSESIKNIVIVPDDVFNRIIHLTLFKNVENIYFDMFIRDNLQNYYSDHKEEKGLVIDYKVLSNFVNRNIDIYFSDEQSKIFNKAKIVYKKKEFDINIEDSVNRVLITKHRCDMNDSYEEHDKPVDINFYTDKEIYTYTIDLHLNLKQSKKVILDKSSNSRLDIKDIRDYDGVDTNFLRLRKLIINTSDINNINNNDLSNMEFVTNKLEIHDDDEMRLFPQSTILDINRSINVIPLKDKISICSNGMFNNFIINVDKDYNVTRIDYDTLKKEYKNIDNVYNVNGKYGYLIIIKYKKDNKYTIITDNNKVYKIDKLFNKFFSENMYKYSYIRNPYPYDRYGDRYGFELLDYIYTGIPDFKNKLDRIYSDYLKYLNNLKGKLESGLTKKELYKLLFDTSKNDDTDVHKKIAKTIIKELEINN